MKTQPKDVEELVTKYTSNHHVEMSPDELRALLTQTRVGSGWQLDDPTPPTVEELIAELDSLIFVDHEKTIVHVDCDKPYLLNLIEKALTQTIAEYQEDIKLLTEEIEHLRKDLANLINAVPDNHRD